jgi:hypothetical protein
MTIYELSPQGGESCWPAGSICFEPGRIADSVRLSASRSAPFDHHWDDFKRSHHVIVLMFQHVAMKDIAAGVAFEAHEYRQNVTGIDNRRILPPGLIRCRNAWLAREYQIAAALKGRDVESLAMQNLELHQMQVHRVRIMVLPLVSQRRVSGSCECGRCLNSVMRTRYWGTPFRVLCGGIRSGIGRGSMYRSRVARTKGSWVGSELPIFRAPKIS